MTTAAQCRSVENWRTRFPGAAQAARRRGCYREAVAQIPKPDRSFINRQRWAKLDLLTRLEWIRRSRRPRLRTEAAVIESAAKHATKTAWQKADNGAVKAAKRYGWYAKATAHMPGRHAHMSEAHKARISAGYRAWWNQLDKQQHRENLAKICKGQKFPEIARIRAKEYWANLSGPERERISNKRRLARLGKPLSADTRLKVSKALTGRSFSAEARMAMRYAQNDPQRRTMMRYLSQSRAHMKNQFRV